MHYLIAVASVIWLVLAAITSDQVRYYLQITCMVIISIGGIGQCLALLIFPYEFYGSLPKPLIDWMTPASLEYASNFLMELGSCMFCGTMVPRIIRYFSSPYYENLEP